MHFEPDISVVIAAKNEAQYVAEAVDSVIAQADVTHELIFIDDASEDDTLAIVSQRADRHANLRVLRNPGKGKVSAFNYGVSQARGAWVCLFAGDDIMPSGSLAARWQAVKHIESAKPVVGLCRLITMSAVKSHDGVVVPKKPNRGGLTGVSYLMDRRAVAKLFPVPDSLPNEDTWLETGVLHFDLTIVHSGVIGCKWRVHAGNSVNMLVPYADFNNRITRRMRAYSLFLSTYGAEIAEESRKRLEAKVECEEGRKSGNALRILRSGASTVEKLRALSLSSRPMYEVRRRLYGLLSGW
jgi:glycosyltransferase involved in cell wall biosynthesis